MWHEDLTLYNLVRFGVPAMLALILLSALGRLYRVWLRAFLSGARVPFIRLIAMRLRKSDPETIVGAYISALKAGVVVTTDQLEAHGLAGGKVPNVVEALIAAKHGDVALTWQQAMAIDLAGHDVVAYVKERSKLLP